MLHLTLNTKKTEIHDAVWNFNTRATDMHHTPTCTILNVIPVRYVSESRERPAAANGYHEADEGHCSLAANNVRGIGRDASSGGILHISSASDAFAEGDPDAVR